MDQELKEFKEKQRQQLMNKGAIADALKHVKYKIAILSGKGGVGKTATTVNLAVALTNAGHKVGVFDADLHGPSVPKMLGIKTEAKMNGAFWIDPVLTESGIKALSVALFWPGEMTPVMWRGQTKSRTIRQLLSAGKWGALDFLLVDLPPGTGDEPIAILKSIPDLDGVIIVTTPQEVSTLVCSKAISASRSLGANVLGLVENMSSYTCKCGDVVHLFGKDKGKQLAKMMEIPFLGSIPIDPLFSEAADTGVPVVNLHTDSLTAKSFVEIAGTLASQLPPKEMPEAPPEEESKPCPGSGCHHHHHHEEKGGSHHHHHHTGETGHHH
jgi:ATP-binding protein involved in chromosome partitioning